MNWQTCAHRFNPWFGTVMKCGRCGATTMMTMDPKESKPIYPPTRYEDPAAAQSEGVKDEN